MEGLKGIITRLHTVEGSELEVFGSSELHYAIVDGARHNIVVHSGAVAHLTTLHLNDGERGERGEGSELNITLSPNAELTLTEINLCPNPHSTTIEQAEGSRCNVVTIQMGDGETSYTTRLLGAHSQNALSALFLVSGEEHSSLSVRTEHNAEQCHSASYIKGVAAESGKGEFSGLIYVAKGANGTAAEQQSRNILLSDKAQIKAEPQLEIYADDVKCSHGATVGQMSDDALLYMRQRGLSLDTARRLQVEGFIGDIIKRIDNEELCEALLERVTLKLEGI